MAKNKWRCREYTPTGNMTGSHTVEHAEKLGLGSRQYKLVSIDGKE